MTIPKKGARRIIVDGVPYIWRVRRRATRQMRSGGSLWLAVDRLRQEATRTLLVDLNHAHAHNTVDRAGAAITPRIVAELVRFGLEQGWVPESAGPPIMLTWQQAVGSGRTFNLAGAYAPHHRPLDRDTALKLAHEKPKDTIAFRRLPTHGPGPREDVELLINETPLLALIKGAEEAHVAREREERQGGGPAAADYLADWGSLRWPNKALLGASESDHGFLLDEQDPRRKKVSLCGCPCGIYECWFLLCRIWALPNAFVWSDFEQFHRPWIYDLGPFAFDRAQYLEALGRVEMM